MNSPLKFAIAAAAVVVVAFLGIRLLPGEDNVGVSPPSAKPSPSERSSPSPSPLGTPVALHDFRLEPGSYVVAPALKGEGFWSCPEPIEPDCSNTIGLVLTVPDGWAGSGNEAILLTGAANLPPAGAALLFTRGAALYTDPCKFESGVVGPVGPTAEDFASALADHPLLDVTTPVDVTLAGYSGKYVDLQVPSDPTIQGSSQPASLEGCPVYRPWEPGLLAQGPAQRWHLWILDVDGQRVVVQSTDYAGTSAQDRAELQAIVDSIQIQP